MENKNRIQIGKFLERARTWALANPGKEYRKTVIWDDCDGLCLVNRWYYEEACLESEWVAEIFAIKEPGQAVYSSVDYS